MILLDTQLRNHEQTLAHWIEHFFTRDNAVSLSLQSGYFGEEAIDWLLPLFQTVEDNEGSISVVIGSNDFSTAEEDIIRLCQEMRLHEKSRNKLAIAAFSNSLYHPKVLCLGYHDGTFRAYVGSSNFTSQGLCGTNIEMGVIFATEFGDDLKLFHDLIVSTENYFYSEDIPVFRISSFEEIEHLTEIGVLKKKIELQVKRNKNTVDSTSPLPSLKKLLYKKKFPVFKEKDPVFKKAASSLAIEKSLVWKSKPLTRRDLSIKVSPSTHITGSMLLGVGGWESRYDHRHYFREQVFSELDWVPDPKRPHIVRTTAFFSIFFQGNVIFNGSLSISHNTKTTSKAYIQLNSMTQIHWGSAKDTISNEEFLGKKINLYKKYTHPPEYIVEITDDSD